MINTAGVILAPVNSEQPPRPITDPDLPDRPRVKDVARWLGVHRNTIYTLMHNGDIPYKVIGKRTYIFERAALLDWWAEQEAS